jgi:hypothetical protein
MGVSLDRIGVAKIFFGFRLVSSNSIDMTQHVIFMMLRPIRIQPNVNYTKVGVSLERVGVAKKNLYF